MSGEKNLCSGFPQSTEKAKRCEPSEKQWLQRCSFLPVLGKRPLQIGLCWSQRYNGSRRLNTVVCCSSCWGVGCALFAGLHNCTVSLAGASWSKAGVSVSPDTTTHPLYTFADTHMRVHTGTHMHMQSLESPTPVWMSPLLLQPVSFTLAKSIAHTG